MLNKFRRFKMRPLTIILVVVTTIFILFGCFQQIGQAVAKRNSPYQIAGSAISKSNDIFTKADRYKLVRNVTYQLSSYKDSKDKKDLYIKSTPHLFGENLFIKFKTDSNSYSIKLHLNYNGNNQNNYLGYFILNVTGNNFILTVLDDNFSGIINKAEYHFDSDKKSSDKVYNIKEKLGLNDKSFFNDSFGIHLYIIYKFLSKPKEIKWRQS